jgi:hypothetical protein
MISQRPIGGSGGLGGNGSGGGVGLGEGGFEGGCGIVIRTGIASHWSHLP